VVKLFQVGGSVRDEILGVQSKDLDYSCEASSFEEMRQFILDRGGEIFLEQPQYFTIRAKINKDVSDFVLCRKESKYSDGRRPDKVEIGNIFDDLARRDFTMNAIAKLEDGSYLDVYNGISDIKNGVIKCVGSTWDRFKEDSLRGLRAMRFEITKNMTMSTEITNVLESQKYVDLLHNISQERIREELTKCFRHSTLETLRMLEDFRRVRDFIFDNDSMWLKPTMEEK